MKQKIFFENTGNKKHENAKKSVVLPLITKNKISSNPFKSVMEDFHSNYNLRYRN